MGLLKSARNLYLWFALENGSYMLDTWESWLLSKSSPPTASHPFLEYDQLTSTCLDIFIVTISSVTTYYVYNAISAVLPLIY